MTNKDRKAYMKAWSQVHKDERKSYMKAWRQAHREEIKVYREAHKAYQKDYQKSHREELKAYKKAYYQANKEEHKVRCIAWRQEHREEHNAYNRSYEKSDTNSLGQTKNNIRNRSRYYLFNTLRHTKVEGYEIHHCFGYDDYKKFIYIPRELHLQIHQYLRDNNIDADSDHYSKIEHLIVNYLKLHNRHVLIIKNTLED